MRFACKSIVCRTESSGRSSYRVGIVVRTSWTVRTTYDLGSIQEHAVEVTDSEVEARARSETYRFDIGGFFLRLLTWALYLFPVWLLAGIGYFMARHRGITVFHPTYVLSAAGAALLLGLILVPWHLTTKYRREYERAKSNLLHEVVQKERGPLPEGASLQIVLLEDWDRFLADLRKSSNAPTDALGRPVAPARGGAGPDDYRQCPRCQAVPDLPLLPLSIFRCPSCGALCCDKCVAVSGEWFAQRKVCPSPYCGRAVDVVGSVRARSPLDP